MNVIWGLVLSTMLPGSDPAGWWPRSPPSCKGMERRKTTRFSAGHRSAAVPPWPSCTVRRMDRNSWASSCWGFFLSNGNGDVESFQNPSLADGPLFAGDGHRHIHRRIPDHQRRSGWTWSNWKPYQGFAADAAAAGCLLLASPDRPPRQHHPTPKPPPSWGSARPNAFPRSNGRSSRTW